MELTGKETREGMRSLPPLPQRAVPFPNEDLLSLLRRSSTKMGYPNFQWLLRPEGNHWNIRDKDIPFSLTKQDYTILEELLLLSQEEVKSHTLNQYLARLEKALGPQQSAVLNENFSNPIRLTLLSQKIFFLPTQSIRICPLCLLEQVSYDRLYWRLQLILHCPTHRVPLLEKCPSCEAPIAANRQLAHFCPRCQQEYRMIDQSQLSSTNSFYISERFLLRALGAEIQEDMFAEEAIAQSPISSLSSNSYLYFLHEMTSQLTPGSLEEYSRGEPRVPEEASDTMLAYFLQIPEEDVPRSISPSLITSLHLPRYTFIKHQFVLTEQDLISWLLPDWRSTTRICPYCVVDEEEFDRVFWNLRGVLCCPRHHTRLLEKCPSCLQSIPIIRSDRGSCPFCIAFIEEMDLYYSFSQQQLLQFCHMLGERTIPYKRESVDPYAVDAGVLLFHILFSKWPKRFNTFLTHLYQTDHLSRHSPSDIQSRWRWLLAKKWIYIAPDWFINAFELHAQQHPQIEFISIVLDKDP